MSENKIEYIEAKIAELEPGMKHVNITFKIMNTREEKSVKSRKDGETRRVQHAIVGDSTGTVQMPFWNETIDSIEEGATYTLTNGYARLSKGRLRLHVGKFGSIAAVDESIEKVNTEVNMSAIDYNSN
ncbi:MAG: single-stranded DNA-binding protein [Candidatus Thorarchaeota archaeon]